MIEHLRLLGDIDGNVTELQSRIAAWAGSRGDRRVLLTTGTRPRISEFAIHACLFAPFWLRRPASWDGCGGETGLLEHLFARFAAPAFLARAASEGWGIRSFRWLALYILLAQGGSPKRMAQHLNCGLPNRIFRHLAEIPPTLELDAGLMLAEVRRLGGTTQDFLRLRANHHFLFDPADFRSDESQMSFWYATTRWLIAHRAALSDAEATSVLAWAEHERFERRRGCAPFSWKGRRLRPVLEQAAGYQQLLNRSLEYTRWAGRGWGWRLDGPVDESWTYVELTDSRQLAAESCAMHHCVANYAYRCAKSDSAIVSVRWNGVRAFTVEINPRTRVVVQARGPCNRDLTGPEREVLERWLQEVVRKPSRPRLARSATSI